MTAPLFEVDILGNSPTLLVIDDDPLTVEFIQHKLRTRGIEVISAADGASGLEQARAIHPDVIVLDIMMPVLDGSQVLRELRADPSLKDTPVVMLTARRAEGDLVEALELGADDYVAKPFSPAELAARVDRLLPRRAS